MPEKDPILPRQVANKAVEHALSTAIRMALQIEQPTVRHNTQTFNRHRYATTARMADYDSLKNQARNIKEHAIAKLPELIEQLRASLTSRGAHLFVASNAAEACEYIANTCRSHGARLVVKGKSITSEEIRLNHALEKEGVEVTETDLAEFILQIADEQPSHIVGPALHYSRERITALFKRVFQTSVPLDSGESLTRFARERLRSKFLNAEVGITGANLIAADSGSLMLVESEGNIRMASTLPPVHIALAGIEKVVPSRADFVPFIELLAVSATGNALSSYTSILAPPLKVPTMFPLNAPPRSREFHLVLIDNGRMKMRKDPVLHEALYCIRCGACLNSCANFQAVGGHAFGGETYSGGIGGSWEAGTGPLAKASFSELCTGCSRCIPACPVQIDIPWLNVNLRQRLNLQGARTKIHSSLAGLGSIPKEERNASLQKLFFGNYHVFAKMGAGFPGLTNWATSLFVVRCVLERLVGLDRRRILPRFAKSNWLASPTASTTHQPSANLCPPPRVAAFADIYTAYNSPGRGIASLQVLQQMGMDVVLTRILPSGRAAFSQGMIETARQQAAAAAHELKQYLSRGRDIVVVEPSVLAMFRLEYRHLLYDAELVKQLGDCSFDVIEYAWNVACRHKLDLSKLFDISLSPVGKRLFFHSHCQQKTTRSDEPTIDFLKAVGFEVVTSQVECCGMAGSFGYKKEFYDLSMSVGEDLFTQVVAAGNIGPCSLIASGTSCCDQFAAKFDGPILHPAEILAAIRTQNANE